MLPGAQRMLVGLILETAAEKSPHKIPSGGTISTKTLPRQRAASNSTTRIVVHTHREGVGWEYRTKAHL